MKVIVLSACVLFSILLWNPSFAQTLLDQHLPSPDQAFFGLDGLAISPGQTKSYAFSLQENASYLFVGALAREGDISLALRNQDGYAYPVSGPGALVEDARAGTYALTVSGSGKYMVFWDSISSFQPATPAAYALAVSRAGTGSGTVTFNPPGTAFSLPHSESYISGAAVTLAANPDGSSAFSGWSGGCSGTGACQLTMDNPRAATAAFATVYPVLASSPTSKDFGSNPIGSATAQSFTITNIGPASTSALSVTGPASPFSITASSCNGAVLAPGSSCSLTAQFQPSQSGDFSGAVRIDFKGTIDASDDLSISLSGKGYSLDAVDVITSCTIPTVPPASDINFQSDVAYATSAGVDQKMDIAWPKTGGLHPLVVLIHGGGWITGSKTGFDDSAKMLAGQGYAAATIDYSLGKQFPAAVADVRCAVKWLRSNAAAYSIDPNRVAALGSSAGGQLAGMLGTASDISGLDGTCPISGSPSVNAVIGYFGPYDLRCSSASDCNIKLGQSLSFVTTLLGGAPYTAADAASKASPLVHIDSSDPPFLLVHSTADTMVPIAQSRNMKSALQAAGVPATIIENAGGAHGYPVPFSSSYMTATCTTLKFLQERL